MSDNETPPIQPIDAELTRLDPDERLTATSCQFSEGPAVARAG